jgi:hypothetical protein
MLTLSLSNACLRRYVIAAVAAFAALTAVPSSASAHGDYFPYHDLGPTYCVDGRMEVYGPRDVRSSQDTDWRNPEQVQWSPDLYRYNRRQRRWRRVYEGAWFYGFAHSYGLTRDPYHGSHWYYQDARPLNFLPITIKRHGRYRIKHFIYWPWMDETHRQNGRECRYR